MPIRKILSRFGIPRAQRGRTGVLPHTSERSGIEPRYIRPLLGRSGSLSSTPNALRALPAISGTPSPAIRTPVAISPRGLGTTRATLAIRAQFQNAPASAQPPPELLARSAISSHDLQATRAFFARSGIRRAPRVISARYPKNPETPRTTSRNRSLFAQSGISSRAARNYRELFATIGVFPNNPPPLSEHGEISHFARAIQNRWNSTARLSRKSRAPVATWDIPDRPERTSQERQNPRGISYKAARSPPNPRALWNPAQNPVNSRVRSRQSYLIVEVSRASGYSRTQSGRVGILLRAYRTIRSRPSSTTALRGLSGPRPSKQGEFRTLCEISGKSPPAFRTPVAKFARRRNPIACFSQLARNFRTTRNRPKHYARFARTLAYSRTARAIRGIRARYPHTLGRCRAIRKMPARATHALESDPKERAISAHYPCNLERPAHYPRDTAFRRPSRYCFSKSAKLSGGSIAQGYSRTPRAHAALFSQTSEPDHTTGTTHGGYVSALVYCRALSNIAARPIRTPSVYYRALSERTGTFPPLLKRYGGLWRPFA